MTNETEVRNEANVLIGTVHSYEGYPQSRSKTNRPGSRGNTLRKLWAAQPVGQRTSHGFTSKKDAIKFITQ